MRSTPSLRSVPSVAVENSSNVGLIDDVPFLVLSRAIVVERFLFPCVVIYIHLYVGRIGTLLESGHQNSEHGTWKVFLGGGRREGDVESSTKGVATLTR